MLHWAPSNTHLDLMSGIFLGGPVAIVFLLSLLQFPEIILDQERGIKLSHRHFIVCAKHRNQVCSSQNIGKEGE